MLVQPATTAQMRNRLDARCVIVLMHDNSFSCSGAFYPGLDHAIETCVYMSSSLSNTPQFSLLSLYNLSTKRAGAFTVDLLANRDKNVTAVGRYFCVPEGVAGVFFRAFAGRVGFLVASRVRSG